MLDVRRVEGKGGLGGLYHKSIKRPLDNARDDNNGTPKLTVLN